MKTFIAAAALFTSVAYAQIPNVPQCALNCFVTAFTSDGCSDLTDFKCHCGKQTQLISNVVPCVQKACSAQEQSDVLKTVQDTCKSAGVPITVPVPTPGSGGSATPSASPSAAQSSGASSPAGTTPSASRAASSAVASAASSAASAASSAVRSATSAAGNATTARPSASQFTGAAAATQVPAFLAALAMAAAAL